MAAWQWTCLRAVAFCGLVGSVGLARASITIDPGTHQLAPNTANQIIEIMVQGNDQVAGLNLGAELGDGTTDQGFQFNSVDAVDAVSPSLIFGPNNTGDMSSPPGSPNLFVQDFVSTAHDSVTANGKLVHLSIDVGNVAPGTYPILKLTNSSFGASGDTTFTGTGGGTIVPAFMNDGIGTFVVVPEPAAGLLGLLGAAILVVLKGRNLLPGRRT